MNLFGCGGPLRPTKKYFTSIRLGRANPLVSIGECQGLVCVVVGDESSLSGINALLSLGTNLLLAGSTLLSGTNIVRQGSMHFCQERIYFVVRDESTLGRVYFVVRDEYSLSGINVLLSGTNLLCCQGRLYSWQGLLCCQGRVWCFARDQSSLLGLF
jgi:hypothetical protein